MNYFKKMRGTSVIGVASYDLFHAHLWIASSFAVATAIAAMHATKTLHPSGGATALIAVIGSQKVHGALVTCMQ